MISSQLDRLHRGWNASPGIRLSLAAALLLVLGLIGIGIYIAQLPAPETRDETPVATPAVVSEMDPAKEFLLLQTRIAALQDELAAFYQFIEPLFQVPNQLDKVKAQLDNAIDSDALQAAEANLQQQLNEILQQQVTLLTTLSEQRAPEPAKIPSTPTAADLPFTPVSIDRWNGYTYLWIRAQEQEVLLAEGESFDDWRITQLDFENQQVQFQHTDFSPLTIHVR